MSVVLKYLEDEISPIDPTGVGFNIGYKPLYRSGWGGYCSDSCTRWRERRSREVLAEGMAIDPVTGLPIDGGGAGPVGGAPAIDPITGLPVNTGAPGAVSRRIAGSAWCRRRTRYRGRCAGARRCSRNGRCARHGDGGMVEWVEAGGGAAPSTAMQGAFDPEQVKINELTGPFRR